MNKLYALLAASVAASFIGPAFSQTTATVVQRNENQQKRIEHGLKSGELSTNSISISLMQ